MRLLNARAGFEIDLLKRLVQPRLMLVLLVVFVCQNANGQSGDHKPKPGELYREFALHNGGDRDWRVTDANAVIKFARAKDHLPNSRLKLDVEDLQHAVRAEVLLDRWGGHRGTINKRIRFNENEWVTIPEIQNTPVSYTHLTLPTKA